MRDLMLHGELAGVRPGMSRDDVRAKLGAPDDFSAGAVVERADIWRYGNFEVHFDGAVCSLLFNDYLHSLDAGPGRELERFILEGAAALTYEEVLERLRAESVAFTVQRDALGRHAVHIEGGAKLDFDTDGSGRDGLCAVAVTPRAA